MGYAVIIVNDTSPLMNLAVVGCLELLHALYDTVLIPEAVWNELSALSSHHPEVATVQTLSWLERQPVTSTNDAATKQSQPRVWQFPQGSSSTHSLCVTAWSQLWMVRGIYERVWSCLCELNPLTMPRR